jgi:histone H1/5
MHVKVIYKHKNPTATKATALEYANELATNRVCGITAIKEGIKYTLRFKFDQARIAEAFTRRVWRWLRRSEKTRGLIPVSVALVVLEEQIVVEMPKVVEAQVPKVVEAPKPKKAPVEKKATPVKKKAAAPKKKAAPKKATAKKKEPAAKKKAAPKKKKATTKKKKK